MSGDTAEIALSERELYILSTCHAGQLQPGYFIDITFKPWVISLIKKGILLKNNDSHQHTLCYFYFTPKGESIRALLS